MLNSVHVSIAMGFRPFSSDSDMWLYLCNVYQQSNLAREFEVECNIAEYIQGDKNGLRKCWENDKGQGWYTVLREETRLGTQAAMESMPLPTIALLEQKSTIGTSSGNAKRSVQCYECNDFGHIATNCPKEKKFCAYCKITGHHISDCHRRPNCSRLADQAYEMDVTKSAGSFRSGHDLERLIQDSIAAALPGAISSALSASSGTSNSIKSTWHLDSGASNHMTGDLSQFSSLYDDVSKHVIHTANGHTLPASESENRDDHGKEA
ncbi:hypothetical protein KY290_036999 [Solanum tuberosum]|uniref:CCHC-type domain-containing protein n=1 Tax=Solanum tuberosum TaxID=4113 RepID=A0ABQ7TU95_SOLTU|nr:hypothetical protein KY290_036999 [Solanum tuberosum]